MPSPDIGSSCLPGVARRVKRSAVSPLAFDRDQSPRADVPQYGTDEPDGVRSMPTEIIVIAIVAAAFGLFAATLYWADLQTRGLTK